MVHSHQSATMKLFPLVLVVMVSSTFTEACPDNCRCTNRKIFCRYSSIKSLPEGSPTTTLVSMERDFLINLNDSVIGKSRLANLTTLRLISMHVESIQAAAFRTMKKLESLTIIDNKITDLQPGAFTGLGELYILDLSSNSLKNLSSGVFEGLGGLRHLNLTSNPIWHIHFGAFDGLMRECNCQMSKTPSILDLSETKITEMDEGAFRNLCFFTQLKFSFFTGFQTKDLCSLRSLQLQYHYSFWSGILEGLYNVIHVSMYKCYLTKIPNQFLKESHLLKKLNISHSRVEELEFNCFQGLQNLSELDLSHNRIKQLNNTVFTELRYLKKLDLSHNILYTIHESNFMGLSHLRFLDISHNALQSIKAGTFSKLSSLRELNIDNAYNYRHRLYYEIETIQSEAFLGLFSLKSLQLPYNTPPNVTLDSMHRLDDFEGPGDFVTNNLQVIKSLSFVISGVNITPYHIETWVNHILYFNQSINLKIYDLTSLRELKIFYGFHISDLSIINIKTGLIENNSFEYFSNLTSLTITSISNITIYLGAFRNLENLVTLTMVSEWGFIQPKEGAFEELSNLNKLSIRGSGRIFSFDIILSSNTFKGMKSLTELEIMGNEKLSLHGDPFHELENLEILDLRSNYITELNKGTFRGLQKLESLDLTLNNISVLREGTFFGLRILKELDLRFNLIQSISFGVFGAICDDNFTLTCANLTRLWRYCDTQFVLENLTHLDLTVNGITYIHQHAFLGCNKLQTLKLDQNRLKTLDFLYTPELTGLDLNGNRNLSKLENSTFNCTTKLFSIDFSFTNVKVMDVIVLQHLKQLKEIKLPPMKCDCTDREIWQWLRSRNVLYEFEYDFKNDEDIDLCLSQIDCNTSKTIINNQRHETSAESNYVHFITYIEPVVFIFTFLSGCFGNGFLLFIILRHSDMRNKNNICVAHLAIVDILSLILNLPLSYWDSVHVNWDLGETSCKLFMGSKDLAVSLVVFSVVSLAFERYLVVQSFNTMKISNGSVARPIVYLVLVWMHALATSIPTYLRATVEGRCYLSSPGIVDYIRFLQTFQLIMNCCSPVAIIIYLNIVTVYTLRKSISKIPGVLSNQPHNGNRNTVVNTVTILSVVFTLSYVPNFLLRTLVSWSVWKAEDVFWYSFFSYCLFFLHSICNPFALFVMSSKFKKHIREYISYFVHENVDYETNPNVEKSLLNACQFLHKIPIYLAKNERQDDVQILSNDELVRQARLERLKKLQHRFR